MKYCSNGLVKISTAMNDLQTSPKQFSELGCINKSIIHACNIKFKNHYIHTLHFTLTLVRDGKFCRE